MTQPQPTTSAQSVAVEPVLLRVLARIEAPTWIGEAIQERTRVGVERYGLALHTYNGRDAALDLREELLDALQYLMWAHLEGRISGPVYLPALCALVEVLETTRAAMGEPCKEKKP